MKCPHCASMESKVVDSRPSPDGASIKRRRECLACQHRFTTYEVIETMQIVVLKKDGSKELFDRSKLLSGLLKACYKRPVDAEGLAIEIEAEIQNGIGTEISTQEIGEIVMEKLRLRDEVAYVRFASVYREFKDIETFLAALHHLRTPSPETGSAKGRSTNYDYARYDGSAAESFACEEAYCVKENADGWSAVVSDEDEDPKLPLAIEFAVKTGAISLSVLQRRFQIGYGRAASIIDRMEELGVIGPCEGSKARKVLMTEQEYRDRFQSDADGEDAVSDEDA